MFATYLTNLLVWSANLDLVEVPAGWSIAMSCVLGNRVILNVRRIGREVDEEHLPHHEHTHQDLHTHSTYNTNPEKSRNNHRSRSWNLKGKARKRDSEEMVEVESETLTEMEMAQLREMRADYDQVDGQFLR
ncbi:hypothetical protein V5O48_017922 [Marasmius crinis-equi]|uniref:Uncharacterized protein n=1 Tax=Marasmius crinis-equi TaxID=585013 RepID=A0ABR3EMK8_9AGAR